MNVRGCSIGWSSLLIAGIIGWSLTGCSKSDGGRAPVIPVGGLVHVDGKPAQNVQVQLVNVNGVDPKFPTIPSGFTDPDGRFAITSYDVGDGAPAGEYTATFTWREIAIINQGNEMPDKLKGNYANPSTSTIKVKVEGNSVDMGTIELSTKRAPAKKS